MNAAAPAEIVAAFKGRFDALAHTASKADKSR
jgi:hypothetical protein